MAVGSFILRSSFAACCLIATACARVGHEDIGIWQRDDSTFIYRSPECGGWIGLSTEGDSVWRLCHYVADSLVDVWTLRDSVYRFDCGDVTGDSVPEILVGVVRATRYRPERDRRLFIFKLYRGELIRPLWLGSRVGLPLVDFRVERDSLPAMVHTWERRPDSTLVEAVYRYQGFGLKFVRYLSD
ncbi:MAG: nuclear receptor-binding factor 2 [Bacteroidaceae bacterium]|nr:nuclear receptor-binding factor 2 [Bacteroidaceae bacterium]